MNDTKRNVLNPFPAYKDSHIPWVGKIPQHWELVPNKAIMTMKKTTVGEEFTKYRLLSLTKQGVIPRDLEEAKGKFPESFETYQVVEPGDLVFCLFDMDETPRTIGITEELGMVTGAYTRFVCLNEITRDFTYLLYRFVDDQKALKPLYSGLRKVINKESFLSAKIAIPPLEEQTAIVRYLDEADQNIQAYISAKEKLIALLEEHRQAIIHQAVTRGLDPNVKLKPSGVEWLGDVPEHWEVHRAKFFYKEADDHSVTGAEELMSVSHITGVTPRKKTVTMFLAESNIGYKLCKPGDIVINTMWAYMAALGVTKHGGLVSPSYGVYRPHNSDQLNYDYMSDAEAKARADSLLRTEPYRANYLIRSTGITSSRLRLYAESFLDIPFLCPPRIEQEEIVKHLEQATNATNDTIARTHRQIELMEEYRTRLIADVVTGKLDVR